MADNTKLMSSWEAANMMGVHESTIRRWERQGWIKKHVGKHCRDVKYDLVEIKTAMRQHYCPVCGKRRV